MSVFNGGLRLRVSHADGRLQRKPTPQILFIGVFSTNGNAVFVCTYLSTLCSISYAFSTVFTSENTTERRRFCSRSWHRRGCEVIY